MYRLHSGSSRSLIHSSAHDSSRGGSRSTRCTSARGTTSGARTRGTIAITVETGTGRWLADLALLDRTHTHDLRVDRGRNAVVHLAIDLGKSVVVDRRGFFQVTNGRLLDDVPDNETLNSLVLGHVLATVLTAHTLDVAAALLVAPIVSSLLRHPLFR